MYAAFGIDQQWDADPLLFDQPARLVSGANRDAECGAAGGGQLRGTAGTRMDTWSTEVLRLGAERSLVKIESRRLLQVCRQACRRV